MTRFLLFTLYAPLGSLGTLACGARRPSQAVPARSMLLGVLGAALGLPRTSPHHETLRDRLCLACALHSPRLPLWDYHTVQVPKGPKGAPTRRAQLEGVPHTVLSQREWMQSLFCTAAVWGAGRNPRKTQLLDTLHAAPVPYTPLTLPTIPLV